MHYVVSPVAADHPVTASARWVARWFVVVALTSFGHWWKPNRCSQCLVQYGSTDGESRAAWVAVLEFYVADYFFAGCFDFLADKFAHLFLEFGVE
jgi:hypothetical protein